MNTDFKSLARFYEQYLRRYPSGGGWPTYAEAQEVYKNATSSCVIPWAQITSVLDVGSGSGGLLPYLRREVGYTGQYTGVEALGMLSDQVPPELLKDGKASFLQRDFLEYEVSGALNADWVFAIGTLGTAQPCKAEYDLAMILAMAAAANVGFTIDLNDIRVIAPERLSEVPGLVAHDLAKLLGLFSPHISYTEVHIVHDEHKNCAVNVRLKGHNKF